MNLIIKVRKCNLSGEYDLANNKDHVEHLNDWERRLRDRGLSGELLIGYYTFREQDPKDGEFHSIAGRDVDRVRG